MSVDTNEVSNGVDGGKVWTPGGDKFSVKGLLTFEGFALGSVTFTLFLCSGSFADSYEGVMTEEIIRSIKNEQFGFVFSSIFTVLTVIMLFALPLASSGKMFIVSALGAVVLAGGIFYLESTKGTADPFNEWLQDEYNYQAVDSDYKFVDYDKGEAIMVRDLNTDTVKAVELYIIDEIAYLATDEADLNKQIKEQNG